MTLRFLIFFLGLGCIAFGVAVTSKALLGTTPIAAIPYSMSLIFPSLSFGNWVIIFNLSLLGLEWLLLRGKIRFWTILLQAFLTCTFGSCVDLSMFALLGVDPHTYWMRVLWVCGGSLILASGVFLTLKSNIAVLPGDGFILALAAVTAKNFARLRLLSDLGMSVCALLLCWFVLEDLAGVREGTILASLLTSPMVRLLMRIGNRSHKQN